MKFKWKASKDNLQFLCHQEAFLLDMVDRYNLIDCNKSPQAVLFRQGTPVDTIPSLTLPTEEQAMVT